MRKALGLLVMLLVVSVFVLTLNNRTSEETVADEPSSTFVVVDELDTIREGIEAAYPGTPKELVETYNTLLGIQYHDAMMVEYIPESVELARMFYTVELNALNSEMTQVVNFEKEHAENQASQFGIIASDIERIEFQDEQLANVWVNYETTEGILQRVYDLVRQDEQWKIHKWSDKLYEE